ncbi:melanocyte-stimulating hormone receptor-like [Oculina patagonica]
MNISAENTTLLSCSLGFIPLNPANISVGVFTAFVVKTSINVFTCPFTILLNILVMVAVKKKRQLRTKSNIALACLATTDLAVGLFLQPVQIATYSMILKGDENSSKLCTTDVSKPAAVFCISSSLFHLFLMSGERYLAIKHSFAYETGLVSEARIIIASGVAWVSAAMTVTVYIVYIVFERHFSLLLIVYFCLFLTIIVTVYFNVAVYREVRCSERQNIANQVSLEAKARLLKNKKAFYTTTIVLLTIILCYIPLSVWMVILTTFKDRISANVGHIVLHLTLSMTVLNSLFNPLIYAVRIRYFRVAFIQLLSRKNLVQAEELESRTFRSRRIGVLAVSEQEKHRASREEDVQQTISNEGDINTTPERIKSTSEAWQ